MYRHRKGCAALEPELDQKDATNGVVINHTVHNIQNIQVNAPSVFAPSIVAPNVIAASESQAPSTATLAHVPGWPTGWPVPPVTPNPFSPPGFSLSLEQLTSAVGALPESVREACRRGDQTAIVQLLMGILRRIHADPQERNVYMNPRRGDQALVYIPEHWVTCALDEAGRAMYRRIADILGCLPRQIPQEVRTVAAAARQRCAASAPELVRASRAALSAHLENVRNSSAAGLDWLGTGADDEETIAFFGQERTAHLQVQAVVAAAEASSRLYDPSQVTEEAAPRMASRALAECARYMVHGHPGNLTILPGPGGQVYVHARRGWEPRPRAQVEQDLVARIGWVMADLLYEAAATPLQALRPWFESRHAELAGEEAVAEIMRNYAAASARYYGGQQPRPDAQDRREAARRIVSALTQPAITREAGRMPPAPGRGEGPADQEPLTESDLEELLGW